ncbi:MAG: hypothetical protein Q7T11_01335, partial [Deltaproteobacteria bacterium]|nr:hypothetical protein [Deltaproteobacteria bacterium]
EADFKKWAPMEADVYRKSFEAEAKTHAVERDMQKARYIDFISEMQDDMRGPSLKALAEYAKIFDHYLEQARDIGRPDSKTKEHQRKVTECDLFFAWLKLHWAVTDALKKTGDPRAGKIKLFSAMFTNQVELLNQFSSDQLEGLRPIVESMTFEQVSDLYFEALLAGNDPRVLDRVMGRWGLHATSIATNEVKVYGAGVLAGTLGQSSGAHLFGHGASILQEDQIGFGAVPQMMGFSPNHQGFSDYTFVVAFLASLGLGRPWVVYEAKNFDPLPVWGRVLGGGDGIGFERDKGGSNVLGQRMVASADRGISPVGFDWGTRRFTTAPNPFAEGPLASFLPREMILGGSIAEIGHAARTSHIPFVPVYQNAGSHNVEPDIGLTGNLYDKNFRRPWSIHGGAVLRTGPAVLAFGDPVPGWVMPGGAEDLARMGLTGIPALSGTNRDARYLTAAHTEVGRLHAFKRTLRPSGGQGGLTQGSGQITAASSKPAPQGTHAKPKAGARGGILGRWSPRGAPRSAVPARVAAPH